MTNRHPFQEKLHRLDLELRKNMVGMKPLHHSTGDWDFSAATWDLDTSIYISSPSALRVPDSGTSGTQTITTLVKTSTVPIANVKEGRIITYFITGATSYWARILFRYQDASNYFYVLFQYITASIYRVIDGTPVLLDSGTIGTIHDAWKRFRVTWWNDYVGLVIRVEWLQDSTWVIAAEAYSPGNEWKDIGGRVGLVLNGNRYAGNYTRADDTYIYGIV